ncbi:MAG: hypothetical protein WAK28_01350, partial [Trebonia sp.]
MFCLLRHDDLPSPSGAVILLRPLIARLPTGSLQQDIAFTWRSPWRQPLPGGIGFRGAELPAVRMSGYVTAARASREVVHPARAQGLAVPPMPLDTVWSLPLHPVTPGQVHDCNLLAAGVRRLNSAYWQDEAHRNPATDQAESAGEYASGAILDEDQDGMLGSRFLYAFWRLCEQKVAAVQAACTGHSAQVTAARAAGPPGARIVTLRRAGSPNPGAGPPGAHQWHHHWVVRMHKVRQRYPSLQQHKVIYSGPFI